MNTIKKSKFTWAAFAIAIIEWSGVAYFARLIMEMQREDVASIAGMTVENDKRVADAYLHSTLQNTKEQREALDALIETDIVSIVNMLDRVGREVGTTVKINSTQPESSTSGSIRALVFTIYTEGTFTQIERATELFETLPIPSTVRQFEMTHDPDGWSLNAQVRVLTTATI